jgi:hypothetical protein
MKIAQLLLLLVVACCSASAQTAQTPQPTRSSKHRKQPLSIAISTEHTTVKAGSEILVKVVLTNRSSREVWVDSARLAFPVFTLTDSDGKIPLTNMGRCWRGLQPCEAAEPDPSCKDCTIVYLPLISGPEIAIAPHGSLTEPVAIPQGYYDLSQPGKYTIRVERASSASDRPAKSNALVITVVQ